MTARMDDASARLVGRSPRMDQVLRTIRQVAPARATVLLTGESGSGKGELARALHAMSPRAAGPFVTAQCAALAETLIDSELFGHEKGSFTGAVETRRGRFEQAHGGTLFLDEVGEITPRVQVKLLRVLQERAFERVGGSTVRVDVRLVAATHRDLEVEVARGRFREDLYYRLRVVRVQVPPLRERREDILPLAAQFLARFCAENGRRTPELTDAARGALLAGTWPGNVRELENAIEHAVVVSRGGRIDLCDLPASSTLGPIGAVGIPGASLKDLERYAILRTLESVGWSTSRAARILGIGTRTIQYRIQEYGVSARRLDPERPADEPLTRTSCS